MGMCIDVFVVEVRRELSAISSDKAEQGWLVGSVLDPLF
jgi:hypothetical protein